eukprot:TRINITY_DN835_c0_g1_i1.p1 TRINITY_DN835_c0_g1~~TRINITY_DN835_c0_g1_i1.p1  ORF type:complete len:102 (+),score=52.99 TRINITY_DN835_c0_g1_i1:272-577(+)
MPIFDETQGQSAYCKGSEDFCDQHFKVESPIREGEKRAPPKKEESKEEAAKESPKKELPAKEATRELTKKETPKKPEELFRSRKDGLSCTNEKFAEARAQE